MSYGQNTRKILMLKPKNFYEMVPLCKKWAKILRPYTTFNVNEEIERKLNQYRIWNVDLDGYNLCIFYTETELEDHLVKSIQIFSKNLYTLPFHIVFKVGMSILGPSSSNIYFSFVRDGSTVFCWTKVEEMNGKSAPLAEEEIEYKEYLGKKFACIIEP